MFVNADKPESSTTDINKTSKAPSYLPMLITTPNTSLSSRTALITTPDFIQNHNYNKRGCRRGFNFERLGEKIEGKTTNSGCTAMRKFPKIQPSTVPPIRRRTSNPPTTPCNNKGPATDQIKRGQSAGGNQRSRAPNPASRAGSRRARIEEGGGGRVLTS